ncbi:MAG: hypothetical protein AMJ69_02055 [Gammaproteobacteria bacterium SG8_47]|nr:MAG: hypothetical protein AMJ69_02055 [Gammaproteobacteria bacterium SG8_47]
MSVIQVNNYYAEWIPSGIPDKPGTGRIVVRGARTLTELHWLTNLNADDFRVLLHLLQTEKPLYWDSNVNSLRTSHPQSLDAEPVGEQEG